jgi:uncharacterized protein YbjT (DUF2867 family)
MEMTRAVVTGAAGAQGAAIAEAFRRAGYEVVGLTRRPAPDRPDLTAADTGDEDALARTLEGSDVLAFTSPIDHRPGERETLATRMARAAERAGVRRVVVNTAGAAPDGLDRPVANALRTVRQTFMEAAVPSAVIEPTVYKDNLLQPWALQALADGVLAYPALRQARISWISHASLGAFAVAAAERAVPGGRVFEIGGPEALTGDDVAERLSRAIGRPVRYEETPLDAFAAGLNAAMGAPAGDDIADYYRHLAGHPDALKRDGSAAAELGLRPEPMAAWSARQVWPLAGAQASQLPSR